jgi:hypothetical protein
MDSKQESNNKSGKGYVFCTQLAAQQHFIIQTNLNPLSVHTSIHGTMQCSTMHQVAVHLCKN